MATQPTIASPSCACARARRRAALWRALDTGRARTRALHAIADALERARRREILEANARDLRPGARAGPRRRAADRLTLDEARIGGDRRRRARDRRAAGPRRRGASSGWRLPNGLDVRKMRVPLGVIAVVYEARPNVTIDAAALCLKSGNAIVLRGSSSAPRTPTPCWRRSPREAASEAGLPEGAVTLVAGGGREELAELATQTGVVDLIIPRGGEGLKNALQGRGDRAGDLRRVGQLPRLRRRLGRPRRGAGDHPQRQDPAPRRLQRRRDAARPRARPRRRSCRARWRRCTRPASSCASTRARGRSPATCRSATRPTRTGTRSSWRSCSRWRSSTRSRTRSSTSTRHGSGHSEAIVTARRRGGARLRARRRRRLRLRQRLDALHRRRRVRHGRRDRQLDPEAARARPDRRCASCARSSTS